MRANELMATLEQYTADKNEKERLHSLSLQELFMELQKAAGHLSKLTELVKKWVETGLEPEKTREQFAAGDEKFGIVYDAEGNPKDGGIVGTATVSVLPIGVMGNTEDEEAARRNMLAIIEQHEDFENAFCEFVEEIMRENGYVTDDNPCLDECCDDWYDDEDDNDDDYDEDDYEE